MSIAQGSGLAHARATGQVVRRAKREGLESLWVQRLARGRGNFGWCSICERVVVFVELDAWLREEYRCVRCMSIPRQRALIDALAREVPDWRDKRIHESSPNGPSSEKLARECSGYDASQFWPGVARGGTRDGVRCEDVTALTLDDASLDVFVTQDVFEHVLEPERGFAEVARVLRPGGVHVFTVPWYRGQPTRVRARRTAEGTLEHVEPPDYHGNPVDPGGALVVTEWGVELTQVIRRASGLETTVLSPRDRGRGLDGEFLDVFVSRRPASGDPSAAASARRRQR